MKTSAHNPAEIAPPSSDYAHGLKVEGAETWVHVSGQVGEHQDGTLAGGTEQQMEVCWQRIIAILADSGLTKEDIVKVTAYLTQPEDVGLYRQVRDRMLEGHLAASTLLIVSGLAKPTWTVEIEAVAAR
jgi:2-iminobutanoate/2-iminopropanoate deaminase